MTEDILTTVMAFIYTIGHWIGEMIVDLLQSLTGVNMPVEIVDAIGVLVILTITLAIAEAAKNAIWVIVAVGWVLIILRIAILMIG